MPNPKAKKQPAGLPGDTKLERETCLLPHIVADVVLRELECHLDTAIDEPEREGWISLLSMRANRLYERNENFAKLCRKGQNRGRANFYAFMRHWTGALMDGKLNGREIPTEFHNGLPPGAVGPGLFGQL